MFTILGFVHDQQAVRGFVTRCSLLVTRKAYLDKEAKASISCLSHYENFFIFLGVPSCGLSAMTLTNSTLTDYQPF